MGSESEKWEVRDSTLKKLPDGRLAQRLSPRKKGSHWTIVPPRRWNRLRSITGVCAAAPRIQPGVLTTFIMLPGYMLTAVPGGSGGASFINVTNAPVREF